MSRFGDAKTVEERREALLALVREKAYHTNPTVDYQQAHLLALYDLAVLLQQTNALLERIAGELHYNGIVGS